MSERSELSCPRCSQLLYVGRASELVLHGCGHCGGVWLNNADSTEITKTFPLQAVKLTQRAAERATVEHDAAATLSCPSCSQALSRVKAPYSWVEIDVCKDHGTWFDKGELERVSRALTYVPPKPGLNYQPPPPPTHEDDVRARYLIGLRGVSSAVVAFSEALADDQGQDGWSWQDDSDDDGSSLGDDNDW
jgi:Zn-finger nucleic acid-binding protein